MQFASAFCFLVAVLFRVQVKDGDNEYTAKSFNTLLTGKTHNSLVVYRISS